MKTVFRKSVQEPQQKFFVLFMAVRIHALDSRFQIPRRSSGLVSPIDISPSVAESIVSAVLFGPRKVGGEIAGPVMLVHARRRLNHLLFAAFPSHDQNYNAGIGNPQHRGT